MAEKQIESVSIHPGENGGHQVRHEFKRNVAMKGGRMSGGPYMDRPDSEEHNFGPGEQQEHAIMTHIAKALGFSKVAKAEGAEDKSMEKGKSGSSGSEEDY